MTYIDSDTEWMFTRPEVWVRTRFQSELWKIGNPGKVRWEGYPVETSEQAKRFMGRVLEHIHSAHGGTLAAHIVARTAESL